MNKNKLNKNKLVKSKVNKLKKLSNGEIENLIKNKKEELTRTIQKKRLLEKRLDEKNNELDNFKKEYNEIKNKVDSINKDCEKCNEKVKEEKSIIRKKSIFYNFQNSEELKKLKKEKEELKTLIDKRHEETMNNLMSYIEKQRIDLDYEKNKNFDEINELNISSNLKIRKIEELFTKYLNEFENDKKEEMVDMLENYSIMERNEIIYLKNLYNDHIKNINEIHMNVLQNYKKYYIDRIKENINKIKLLKKKINELEICDKEIKNDLNIYNDQNCSIIEDIKNLEIKRENLEKDLKFYSKDFIMHKNLELIYNESDIYIKNLKLFSQNSKEKINEIEKELKILSEDIKVDEYFENVKNKNILLKKEIENIDIDLDKVNEQLTSFINENNIKKEDVLRVKKGINLCIKTYNKEYDNLLYAEKKIKNKIKDNVNIYEKKLKDIDIKKDN
ncbi:GAS8-like protein, putative [Plasmodium gallinaceum]|uniref:GAS8-like protein, putative n=1 Tax=Plasmodium gallinaceum TaxID=5849 RepID=A0A1J1GWW3_PLAGA|nr:GAS8-like protein, putative [Plasmodium gallinaceum]CRG97051.1 GAS8-like protein, putative [Plasmodium gallinaceum]